MTDDALGVWNMAAERGTEPRIFELGPCDCENMWPGKPSGWHSSHVVREHRPVDEAYVISTVQDMCCMPETHTLAVWMQTSWPMGAQLLLVVADGSAPVALFGRVDGQPQVREAMGGPLYVAMLAALTPVPADDPLVRELAQLSE